jgi:thiol-disulfide isomerase/thioredoxin
LASSFRSRRNWTLALCAVAGLLCAADSPLVLASMAGDSVTLALEDDELALVVHFWATWCPSCMEELGVLERAVSTCEGAVRVVSVNVGEDVETIAAYQRELGFRLPVLRDPRGAVWRDLSGAGLPINLTWTRQQRQVDVGPRSAAGWAETLHSLGCNREDPLPE